MAQSSFYVFKNCRENNSSDVKLQNMWLTDALQKKRERDLDG